MTEQEAISWVEDRDCVICRKQSCENCKTSEALDMAVKALEKQIPKKKHKYQGYRCVCGGEVAKNQRYCEYCGQRLLDWSE